MLELLNKKVSLRISIPINSKKDNITYSLNYGKINYNNALIGAYILDKNIPIKDYSGYVIAIIINSHKVTQIVLSQTSNYTNKEIIEKIYFKEKTIMLNVIRPQNFKSHYVHPFPFIYDTNCQKLILGSFPSVKSRELNFYYMHPQNRFWKVLSKIYSIDFLNLTNEAKRKKLLELHISLYDTITSCDISNSSDSSISDVTYINMKDLPQIKAIYCNGAKSYNLFIKKYPEYKKMVFKMPSTSPANAKCSLNDLIKSWEIIKNQ